MNRQVPRLLFLLALVFQARAESKTSMVDNFCQAIRSEFVEATPRYFSGPDPWVQLDRVPDAFPDAAFATVYYEGSKVRWVVIEMQAPDDAWFETTHYFFDEDGLIKKRERYLSAYDSHIQVHEDQYFKNQRMFKTVYHHAFLTRDGENNPGVSDKEDWDTFFDPNAPFYTKTAELPLLFAESEFKKLAGWLDFSALDKPVSLLKFTRPTISSRR